MPSTGQDPETQSPTAENPYPGYCETHAAGLSRVLHEAAARRLVPLLQRHQRRQVSSGDPPADPAVKPG